MLDTVRFFARRLRNRKDSEHAQAAIRIVITALVAAYLNSDFGVRAPYAHWGDSLSVIYFLISIMLFSWIVARPDVSYVRRYSAMIGEHAFVSLGLLLEGERAAPLFLIYVWVSLGNGFRYGVKPLLRSTLISTVGFGTVLVFSPFWQSVMPISVGILLTMIAIPLYAASLIRALQAAKSAAEQASHSKSRFLATVSHELRTPLHAIIGLSELMQQTSLSSEQSEMLHTVRSSGRALLSLVEDVLDLSSIQAGRVVSRTETFRTHESLAEALAIARPQASRKGLDLAVRIDPRVPSALQGDWPHVRQVLLNLITNAVKFTDTGRVTVSVHPIALSAAETRLVFEVADTGIGIAPEDLERIFETFGQANMSSTRKYGGVGLGLSIVRQVVDLLHGKVSVTSIAGSGSVFRVELPFAIDGSAQETSPDALVAVHSADPRLIELVRKTCPDLTVVDADIVVAEKARTLITLIDARGGVNETIEAVARTASEKQHGGPAAVIAFCQTEMDTIRLPAPVVSSITDPFDPGMLRSAIRIGCALASHREVSNALLAETDLAAVAAFKPDDAALGHGLRVLVVEDSPVNRMVTQKILRSAGYNVILADSADSGLEYLSDEEFDLILLDLNLPGTSGIDIIKLYRVMRLGQEIPPIVIFSADVTQEARDECLELGVSLFLPKPSEPSYMLQKLAELLPEQPAIAPAREAEPEPVVAIASHPRYKPTAELGIVDRLALQNLASLDSNLSFLGDLIGEFETDTIEVLDMLDRSVRDRDMTLFWDQVHAMRSSAANVGARQIMIACADINAQGKMSFATRGIEYAARLRYEFVRFQRTMDRFLAQQQAKAR